MLFMSEDRRRSMLGDALLGERCKPELITAAACREDSEGDRGEGGLGRALSAVLIDILRGRCESGEADIEGALELLDGRLLRSGGIVVEQSHCCGWRACSKIYWQAQRSGRESSRESSRQWQRPKARYM